MADTNNDKNYHDPGQDRFEKSDASFVQIGIWMAVITVLVLLTAFSVWGYFEYFTRTEREKALARRSPLLKEKEVAQEIPGPELQLSPAETMRAFAATQKHDVESYAWASREAGVVRIPVAEAQKKILAEGLLKSRSNDFETTSTSIQDGASMPQDSSGGRTYWNLLR